VDANHQRLTPTNDKCALSGCHTQDLAGIHDVATCSACHAAGVPASKNCETCHDDKVDAGGNVVDHGFSVAMHTAAVGSTDLTGTLPYTFSAAWPEPMTYGGQVGNPLRCGWCHDMNLAAEHDKASSSSSAGTSVCNVCHASGLVAIIKTGGGTWNKTCVQGGCHTATSTRPQHAEMVTRHAADPAGCGPAWDCHGFPPNYAAVHDDFWLSWLYNLGGEMGWPFQDRFPNFPTSPPNGCPACHTNTGGVAGTVPVPQDCTTCHPMTGPIHPN